MNKTLRIVAKDARHLWPEILLSLALTAGFAATDHYMWEPPNRYFTPQKEALRLCMVFLMPIGWGLLIARAVHDEPLVGDRQFWITRPYGWQRVLSAKLLFIASFICVPFFLTQLFLLHQAGLHPMLVLPSLLQQMLLLCGFLLLPLLAFSAVTPTLTRMVLVVLGLLLYIALVAYGCFTLVHRPNMAPGNGDIGAILPLLVPLVSIAVILLQYMRRRTLVSAGLLIGAVLALTAGIITTIYCAKQARGFSALASGEASPISLLYDPDPGFQSSTVPEHDQIFSRDMSPDMLISSVPVSLSNVASGKAVTIEGQQVDYQADGIKGSLPWDTTSTAFIGAGSSSHVSIYIPYKLYKIIDDKPVILHVTFAITEYEAEPARTAWFNGRTLDAPGNAHCVADPGTYDLQCRYALSQPGPTLVSWTNPPSCPAASPSESAVTDWIGRYGGGFQAGFSPVDYLRPTRFNRPTLASLAPVCPGAWLSYVKYHVSRKRLVQVTLPPIDVTLYRFPHNRNG